MALSKAQLESAKLDLSYTRITSPVTGVTSLAAVADSTYVIQMKSRLPEGLDVVVALATDDVVRPSIEEVLKTLAAAMVLVVRQLAAWPSGLLFLISMALIGLIGPTP